MKNPPQTRVEWRVRWEDLTAALESELGAPEPEIDRIERFAGERAQLVAEALYSPPVHDDDAREHLSWLKRAVARERGIVAAAEAAKGALAGFLVTASANRAVTRRLPDAGAAGAALFETRV